jgi:hypothetical protein
MDSWIELTPRDLELTLLAAQLRALRTLVLGPGEEDPLPALIAGVTARVRSAVASSGKYLLSSEAGKIPGELRSDGCILAVERLQTRIPSLRLSPDQVRAAEDARRQLRKIERGEVAVSLPQNPALHLASARSSGIRCVHQRIEPIGAAQLGGL